MIKKYLSLSKVNKLGIFALALAFPISLLVMLIHFLKVDRPKLVNNSYSCHTKSDLKLVVNSSQTLLGNISNGQPVCFQFNAVSGQNLILNTNTKVTLVTPSNNPLTLQGESENILSEVGNYSIIIDPIQENTEYQLNVKLADKEEDKNIIDKPPTRLIDYSAYNFQNNNNTSQLKYNITTPPPFKENEKLQKIVDEIVNLVQSKGLPVDRLSISLVDLSNSECCEYASYLDREPRFPASVVKLFWMVYLYGQYQAGTLSEGAIPRKVLSKMIRDSDNESASLIVDQITGTKPGENLSPEELNKWIQKRYSLNLFFENADYSTINISQKAFPTNYVKNDPPAGREVQMRGSDETNPIRNYMTTYNVARLLFEIETGKSISPKYSQKMKSLLSRDLHPEAWKNKPFNAIEGFFGESLPVNAYFASKMGWNFNTRNDAAIIGSPDKKHKYILVIFGDDASFYKDKKIFPEVSRMVYQKMTN